MDVSRVQVVTLTASMPDPVYRACFEALVSGAPYEMYEGSEPAANLAKIYSVRLSHTQANGIRTLGLPETVQRLRALDDQPVQLGHVGPTPDGGNFVLFFDTGKQRLLACTAVWRPASDRTGVQHSFQADDA